MVLLLWVTIIVFLEKSNAGDYLFWCYFPFRVNIALYIKCWQKNVHGDLGEDPGPQTYISTLIIVARVNYLNNHFPPTLIGLFYVA